MKIKTTGVLMKADDEPAEDLGWGDLEEGQFDGYASVFGNEDSYGDVVMVGAFTETLAEYDAKGTGIPAYWRHRMDDPYLNIGQTVKAAEDARGLRVRVQLDLESPRAAYVHKLVKAGRVSQMSFAYDVLEGAWAERDGHQVYELRKLRVHEVSVVPIGANQETELLAVKEGLASLKESRVLSAANADRLSQAHALIGDVLAEADGGDGKASAEESKSGNAERERAAEDPAETKAPEADPDTALALIALASAGVHLN